MKRERGVQMAPELYLGVGLYTLAEAAWLIGVPAQKLRRWAKGYHFGGGQFSKPLFNLAFPELVDRGILTFHDLIELSLVVRFRQEGVPMRTIRATANRAAERFNTNYPFAAQKFRTDGRDLFAEIELPDQEGTAYEQYPKGQYVFDHVTPPFFRKLDYEAGMARCYWPLGKNRPVVLDPARAFGHPIDVKSGVPTEVLTEMYRSGQSVEEVARWFRIDAEAVRAAVDYERELSKAA
jgi:uncharacterized protein (DUF433 family)